jgi:hypothetical protein
MADTRAVNVLSAEVEDGVSEIDCLFLVDGTLECVCH